MKKLLYILFIFVSCNVVSYEYAYSQIVFGSTNTITAVSSSASTMVRSSTNFTAGRLYLMFVSNAKGTLPEEATLSGTSQTWTKVAGINFNTTGTPLQRVTVYRFLATSTFSATTTISFGATQSHIFSTLTEVTGMATTGTNGSDAIQQSVTAAADATANPTLTMSAISNSNNAAMVYVGNNTNPMSGTPEAGWTLSIETGFTTPARSVFIMYDYNAADNTPTVTAAASDWGAIALEVKAASTRRIISSN